MTRRSLPLLLFGLVGLLVVSGAVSGTGAPRTAWGRAIELGDIGTVYSVSCPTAGNCAAAATYYGSPRRAYVVDETNGRWGDAIEIPGTTNPHGYSEGVVASVSCATPGNCAAGGYYRDNDPLHPLRPYVVDETNGNWGTAIDLSGSLDSYVGLVGPVSCATAGNCVAGGTYNGPDFVEHAFIVEETNGKWGSATDVPGMSTVFAVSCATPGNCAAVGWDRSKAFVVDETNGSWGNPVQIPAPATISSTGYAALFSVSCATAGNCSAGGGFYTSDLDTGGRRGGFVVEETSGSWGTAIEVDSGTINEVSCATAGNCAAVGDGPIVFEETNGSWDKGTLVPRMGEVHSVSCATAGNCAVGGVGFGASGDSLEAIVAKETDGTWHAATKIPGTGDGDAVESPGQVLAVSCATADSCVAGGWDSPYGGGNFEAFVASSPRRLKADVTDCNDSYVGSGNRVIVPAGATCSLLPGTHVTGDVTVADGGTLFATGVGIGGALTIQGSATICASRVRGDVKAISPGGFVDLGGWSCARGNTFLHNVVVRNDSHDLRIHGNTVVNLLVAHSGPVVVINNHATGTIRCVANKPQRGRGNWALGTGTNTCPK